MKDETILKMKDGVCELCREELTECGDCIFASYESLEKWMDRYRKEKKSN